MRCKIFCLLMGAALGTLCVPRLNAEEKGYRPPDPYGSPTLTQPIDVRKAYTDRRWIGVLRKVGSGCPQVDDWKAESLLSEALQGSSSCEAWQPGPEDRTLIRKMGLDRFCVYTARTDPPQPEKLEKLRSAGLMDIQRDRMALSPSASALEQTVSPILADEFLSQTAELTGGEPLKLTGTPSVRLAFIDSQPETQNDEWPLQPQGSQHGFTLMHLAKNLACPVPGRCAAKIVSRRALGEPHSSLIAGADQGGHVGTVSQLAAAITAEVLKWRHAGSPGHLILNLSLGWDGELFGDFKPKAKMDPTVQAVYDALRFAARRGVLVIAAAGNRRGGPIDSTRPLLPAAWETRWSSWCPFVSRKLIYAVGGVDWQGLPLPNSRTGGHPRLAAYGDHAVAWNHGRPTAIYTGSSVSTAVVSSIASVVWHLRPELQPDQVMRLIRLSGEQLKATRADFYPWRHLWRAPSPRRATLCRAVTSACGPSTPGCSALESFPECLPSNGTPPDLTPVLPPAPDRAGARLRVPPTPSWVPPCGSDTQLWTDSGATPPMPCPTTQLGSVASQRWVLPQPEDDPCPGCTLIPPRRTFVSSPEPPVFYTLNLQLDESWLPGKIEDGTDLAGSATLDIDCSKKGRGVQTVEVLFNKNAALQTKEGLGDGKSLMGCLAQLNFTVIKKGVPMSIQNPVVVDP